MLSERLKALRIKHGFTQGELAARINVERSSIAKYEAENGSTPSIEVMVRLADLFHVSLDYLVGREWTETSSLDSGIVMLSHRGARNFYKIPDEKMSVLSEIIDSLSKKEV